MTVQKCCFSSSAFPCDHKSQPQWASHSLLSSPLFSSPLSLLLCCLSSWLKVIPQIEAASCPSFCVFLSLGSWKLYPKIPHAVHCCHHAFAGLLYLRCDSCVCHSSLAMCSQSWLLLQLLDLHRNFVSNVSLVYICLMSAPSCTFLIQLSCICWLQGCQGHHACWIWAATAASHLLDKVSALFLPKQRKRPSLSFKSWSHTDLWVHTQFNMPDKAKS